MVKKNYTGMQVCYYVVSLKFTTLYSKLPTILKHKLLLLTVCFLSVTGAGRDALLLVISEQGGRATINAQSGTSDISKVYQFSDGLSPACSFDSRTTRCREVFVISSQVDNDTDNLVFAPLRSGVGVQELRSDGSELVGGDKFELGLRMRSGDPLDCTILDIFMVDDRVVVPCVAFDSLYSCEVMLNRTFLSSTEIACVVLSNLGRQLDESDYPYITNFVRFQGSARYIFALRENLYQVDFASLVARIIDDLGENRTECERLQYLGNTRLLAYCGSTQAVEVDLSVSTTLYTLKDSGIPYQCPTSQNVVIAMEVLGTTRFVYRDIIKSINSNDFSGCILFRRRLLFPSRCSSGDHSSKY